MKRIVKVSYTATDEEIETVRRFYNLIDSIDQESYDDIQDRVDKYGLHEAIGDLLDALEEEED